jgi:hypothetical protein
MKQKLHHPFHFLALAWLREKMGVNTRAIACDESRTHARLSGHVLPDNHHSVIGFLAVMLLICAATVAVASAQHQVSERLASALGFGAISASVVAVVLMVVDNWRERHLARSVEIVVLPGAEPVDAARLAQLHADARAPHVWIVSELGFTADALALARAHAVRCFAVRKHWIEECWTHHQ